MTPPFLPSRPSTRTCSLVVPFRILLQYATESIALGVEFDRTGTILKSSSDDCVVRLWQRDFEGNWTRVDGFGERVGVGGGTGGGAGEDGNTAGTAT